MAVNMMAAKVLFGDCFALFEVCWDYRMVPSVWKESLVIPVTKTQLRGTRDTNFTKAYL